MPSELIDTSRPLREWCPFVVYPQYFDQMPAFILGNLPEAAARTRGGDPFIAFVAETDEELDSVVAGFSQPVPHFDGRPDLRQGPGRLVGLPSRWDTNPGIVGLYLPPEPGWPYIVLSRWPLLIGLQNDAARGVYTWELFGDVDSALALMDRVGGTGVMQVLLPPYPVAQKKKRRRRR